METNELYEFAKENFPHWTNFNTQIAFDVSRKILAGMENIQLFTIPKCQSSTLWSRIAFAYLVTERQANATLISHGPGISIDKIFAGSVFAFGFHRTFEMTIRRFRDTSDMFVLDAKRRHKKQDRFVITDGYDLYEVIRETIQKDTNVALFGIFRPCEVGARC